MLDHGFYQRPAEQVARDLLGTTLHVQQPHGPAVGRIVETEAYVGPHDLACHAAKGRTKRTEVLFGPGGHAYVYLIYGMYDMLNVVTGADGDAQAVLIRALEPVAGIDGRTDGPGRLTRSLDITVAKHNGAALDGHMLWIEAGDPPAELAVTPRIGVDYAGAWAKEPLRFLDAASRWVTGGAGNKTPATSR